MKNRETERGYDPYYRGPDRIGDCPGLNGAIRTVVRSGLQHGYRTPGIRNGWQGLIDGDTEPLTDFFVSGFISRGGTILGTSRVDPLKKSQRY